MFLLGDFCFFNQVNNSSQKTESENTNTTLGSEQEAISPAASTNPQASPSGSITLAEVANHNKAEDCWMVISGSVYDVTSFIASGEHEGGDEILRGCGIDATHLFETQGKTNGRPHPQKAYNMLDKYYIGVLKN